MLAAIETFVDYFKDYSKYFDEKRNLDHGVELLTTYCNKYPLKNEPWTVIQVEHGFEIVLDPANLIHYFGKIDLVIEWHPYGKLIVDHKTSSWMSDNIIRAYQTDRQFTGYIVGGQQYFDGIYGAMINTLEVTKVKSRAPHCSRELTTRSALDQALFILDTIEIIKQIDSSIETNSFPMSAPYNCTAYYSMCEYFPLCTSHKHPDDTRVPSEEYKEEIWLPFVSEKGL